MEKRWLVLFALAGMWLWEGCTLDWSGLREPDSAKPVLPIVVVGAHGYAPRPMPGIVNAPLPVAEPAARWRPRTHPAGTLLADHEGELWMVMNSAERQIVSGDDSLSYIGLDEGTAIPMSSEEERCLFPLDYQYWSPPSWNWSPVYGPSEEDPGPFLLDWELRTRSRVTLEALRTWGYPSTLIDWFDYGGDEWALFRESDPVGLRTGTLVRTELGIYYVMHDRAYFFTPESLAFDAGYQERETFPLTESRLRELATVTTPLTVDAFNFCPADD